MKRFSHPIRAIREPFGTAGLTVAILALILALVGGAYAAGGGLSGKQKKEVKKIAKAYAGKPGSAGPSGPAGTNGTNGKDGANGTNGSPGAAGAPGESVTISAASSAECPQGAGGAKFTNKTGSAKACNGQTGFTETLPAEKTEKGAWSIGITPEGTNLPVTAAISFNIPLSDALDASHVKYVAEGATAPAGCTGGTAVEPTAEPGFLCVYAGRESFLEFHQMLDPGASDENQDVLGAATTGAVLQFLGNPEASAMGTYAVTAE